MMVLNNSTGSGRPFGIPSVSNSPFSAHLDPAGQKKKYTSQSRAIPDDAKINDGIILAGVSPLHTITIFSLI
jgi:hypothetical protein